MYWLFDNPMDHAAGFPLYLPLPFVLSAALALWLRQVSGWLVWALAFPLAVVAHLIIGVAAFDWNSPTGLAIGLSFTCVAYFPVTGLSVLAVKLAQYFALKQRD